MNDVVRTINRVTGWVAFALAISAALKLFGIRVPVPGSTEANAMVAAALALATLRI